MLRVVLVYENGGCEMPLCEVRDADLAARVAERALEDFVEGEAVCDDPVLRAVIRGEAQQARAALRAAGVVVQEMTS